MKPGDVLKNLSALVFPVTCAVCGGPLGEETVLEVCATCMEKFPRRAEYSCAACASVMDGEVADAGLTLCGACRITPPPFDFSFYGMRYEGTARELIHRFKFGKKFRLSGTVSSMLCAELFRQPEARKADLVVPVPLHRRRLFERGFNQSCLVALEVGKALSLPVETDVLKRVKKTGPQFSLSILERRKNIKDAFSVHSPEKLSGKTVILADDIMTTGATMAAAAKTLKKAGAVKVICAAAARA